jgi:hypothetical protein
MVIFCNVGNYCDPPEVEKDSYKFEPNLVDIRGSNKVEEERDED